MPLEDLIGNNKFIGDLVKEWPLGIDPQAEGDDHIRGVKNVLINTFGEYGGPTIDTPALLQRNRGGTDNGVASGATALSVGNTGNRPTTPVEGDLRRSNESAYFEQYWGGEWTQPIAQTKENNTFDGQQEFNAETRHNDGARIFNSALRVLNDLHMHSQDFLQTDPPPVSYTFSWRENAGGQLKVGMKGYGYGDNSANRLDFQVRDSGGVKIVGVMDKDGFIVGSNRLWNESFESGELTYTNGGSVTEAHGLNGRPDSVTAKLRCVVAEHGYAVGDEMDLPSFFRWQLDTNDGGGLMYYRNAILSWNDTTITVSIANSGFSVVRKSGGGNELSLSPSNWRIVMSARGDNHIYAVSSA